VITTALEICLTEIMSSFHFLNTLRSKASAMA
jgi:hypothetical protein